MEDIQKIETTTFVKLDFTDSLKVLFGRCIKLKVTTFVPQEQPINTYNASCEITIVPTSANFIKQEKPRFGYVEKLN